MSLEFDGAAMFLASLLFLLLIQVAGNELNGHIRELELNWVELQRQKQIISPRAMQQVLNVSANGRIKTLPQHKTHHHIYLTTCLMGHRAGEKSLSRTSKSIESY